jgi:hypothetical protein
MVTIMKTCVILHNMIVEDNERDSNDSYWLPQNITLIPPRREPYSSSQKQIRIVEIKSAIQHCQLTNDLIDMNWARYGARNSLPE